jgi:transposase-like protein
MKADRYVFRQKAIFLARKEGIMAAMREFGCSRNTVRKWIRRCQPWKTASLQEMSLCKLGNRK